MHMSARGGIAVQIFWVRPLSDSCFHDSWEIKLSIHLSVNPKCFSHFFKNVCKSINLNIVNLNIASRHLIPQSHAPGTRGPKLLYLMIHCFHGGGQWCHCPYYIHNQGVILILTHLLLPYCFICEVYKPCSPSVNRDLETGSSQCPLYEY